MAFWIIGWAHLTGFIRWDNGARPEHPAFRWEDA